jgi:hypothetical protein
MTNMVRHSGWRISCFLQRAGLPELTQSSTSRSRSGAFSLVEGRPRFIRLENRHHHLEDIDDIEAVGIQCRNVFAVTVTGPERGTVTQDWKLGTVFGLLEVLQHLMDGGCGASPRTLPRSM